MKNLKNKKIILIAFMIVGALYVFLKKSEYEIVMNDSEKDSKLNFKEVRIPSYKEPAMPKMDENNQKTLGVDSNNNEIRDDVEVWINRVGKNYNERMAIRQYASSLQYTLLAAENGARPLIEHSIGAEYSASICLDFIVGISKSNEISKKLKVLTYNTKQRYKLLENFNKFSYSIKPLVSGAFSGPSVHCFFDIENKGFLIEKNKIQGLSN